MDSGVAFPMNEEDGARERERGKRKRRWKEFEKVHRHADAY